MSAPDYFIRQSDSGQRIEGVVTDTDGVPVSISAATVRFTLAPLTGGVAVVSAAADNDQDDSDPETIGMVSYEWAENDTAVAGHFLAEWEITFQDGALVSFPNAGYVHVLITEQLAPNYA